MTCNLREPQRGSPGDLKALDRPAAYLRKHVALRAASLLSPGEPRWGSRASLLATQGALPLVATLGSVGKLLRSSTKAAHPSQGTMEYVVGGIHACPYARCPQARLFGDVYGPGRRRAVGVVRC